MAYACNCCGATRYRAALSNTASKTDRGIYDVTLHRQRPLALCLSRIRHEEKLQRDGLEWQSSAGLLKKNEKKTTKKIDACTLHSALAQTKADSASQSHASSHLRPDLSARRVVTCRSSSTNFATSTSSFDRLSALIYQMCSFFFSKILGNLIRRIFFWKTGKMAIKLFW